MPTLLLHTIHLIFDTSSQGSRSPTLLLHKILYFETPTQANTTTPLATPIASPTPFVLLLHLATLPHLLLYMETHGQ